MWFVYVLVVASAALLVGCATPAGSVTVSLGPDADADLTYDELFLQIAERVPTFAGLYMDGEEYVIRVTDGRLESAEAARRAAVDVLDHPELSAATIRSEVASYSWSQLFGWYQELTSVLSMDGVVLTDIDEANNAIVIGVSDIGRHGSQVSDLARSREIPAGAIQIVESEPIRQLPLYEER